MVNLLKLLTFIAFMEFVSQMVYSIFVIVLSSQKWGSRLLLSTSGLPESIAYMHPYIEMAVLGGVGVLVCVSVLLSKK